MARRGNSRIVAAPEQLEEGLFGQVFLFVFEILPYLHKIKARPDWRISSRHYGEVIPGALDLAYEPDPPTRDVDISLLRGRHCAQLGNAWTVLHTLWSSYFRIPSRIERQADELGSMNDVLGVHYRGTDKLTANWDTNPVSQADMIAIVREFLIRRPELRRVFLASDDPRFFEDLRDNVEVEVINLGAVTFHKADSDARAHQGKADRAVLDCLILSRCAVVLCTSSALSAFTKVLRPSLEIYRCAASKLFADIPYFPVAYIPRHDSKDPSVRAILERLMADDWNTKMRQRDFVSRPRYRRLWLKWTLIEAVRGHAV